MSGASGLKDKCQRWAWFAVPWLVTTAACSDRATDGSHEDVGTVQLASTNCEGSSIVVDAQASTGFSTVESALGCLARRKLVDEDDDGDIDDVVVSVKPGLYQPFLETGESEMGQSWTQTAPLVIDHREAAHITLQGEAPQQVPLKKFENYEAYCCDGASCQVVCPDPVPTGAVVSHYRFRYVIDGALWTNLVARLHQLCPDPQKAEAECQPAYALIRGTRPGTGTAGQNHALHQGVWQIDIGRTKALTNRLVVRWKHRPQSLDADGNALGMTPLPGVPDAQFDSVTKPTASILTTVLKFNCSSGIVVDGTSLKQIKNLAIVGDYDAARNPALCKAEKVRDEDGAITWSENFPGIEVTRGGRVDLSYVGVSSMDGQGVSVWPSSWVSASRTAASNNERRGFYPTFTGAALLSETIASANHTDGYISDHSSFTQLDAALAIGNSENGYNSLTDATIVVDDSTASHNGGAGFIAKGGANLWFGINANSSDAFRNQFDGLVSEIGGNVRARSLKLEGNVLLGMHFHLGSEYSLMDASMDCVTTDGDPKDDACVDNRDGSDVGDAKAITHPATAPLPRRFVQKLLAGSAPYVPARADNVFEEEVTKQVIIDPAGNGARSLHDFFNVPGPHSIAGKRISLEDAPPRENYLTVKLGAGLFTYRDNPIVITHPDAHRVRIRGESCQLRILHSMNPLSPCSTADPPPPELANCKQVKLALKPDDNSCEPKIGDFIAFIDSAAAPDYQPHWVHRGVWQVSAVNVNGNEDYVKVRNFSGAALENAPLAAQPNEDDIVPGLAAHLMRTVLYFPDPSAGIVVDGTTLGALEDVVLVGSQLPLVATTPSWISQTARSVDVPETELGSRPFCEGLGYASETVNNDHSGLRIQNCGHAYYNLVGVTGFEKSGFRVTNHSTLLPWTYTDGFLAGKLLASVNGEHGFVVINDGAIWAKRSTASANGGSGYYASDAGALGVALSASTANGQHGFEIRNNGYAEAGESAAIRNGLDGVFVSSAQFTAAQGNLPSQLGATAIFAENGRDGCRLRNSAFAAINGAWSILHDDDDDDDDNDLGIRLSEGSKCRCWGLTLKDNDSPILATDGSIAAAAGSCCEGNDNPWSAVGAGTIIDGTCGTCPQPSD